MFICGKLREKHPVRCITAQNDDWGRTPLHFAALLGHLGVCKYIIMNTGDKNPAAISIAAAQLNRDIGVTPLHYAAQEGHLEVCKFILTKAENKNPSTTGRRPNTPLRRAVVNGKMEVCRLFHENGIDLIDWGFIEISSWYATIAICKSFQIFHNICKIFGVSFMYKTTE